MSLRRLDVLIREARERSGNQRYSATQGIAQRSFVSYANDAQERIYNKILGQGSTLFTKEGFIDVVAGQAAYDLPTDIYLKHNVVKVDYSFDGNAINYAPLDMRTPRQEISVQGYPSSYFFRDGQIILSPIPSSSATDGLRLNYQYTIPSLDIRRAEVESVSAGLLDDWSQSTNVFATNPSVLASAYGDGTFVAVGNLGYIATSTDGSAWTLQDSPFYASGAIYSIVYAEGIFVAAGIGLASVIETATSADGITWTLSPYDISITGTPNVLSHGNGTFIIGTDDGSIAHSPDGVVWTTSFSLSFTPGAVRDILYAGSQFLLAGVSAFGTSPDGATWTTRTTGVSGIRSITYGASLYLITGNAEVGISLDGIDWTTTALGTGEIYAGTYGDNLFVVVGDELIATSTDGTTWTEASITTTDKYYSTIEYISGMYIVGGYTDTPMLLSYDGTTWAEQTGVTDVSATADVVDIVASDTVVVVTGEAGIFSNPLVDLIFLQDASGQLLTAETIEDLTDSWVEYVSLASATGAVLAGDLTFISYDSTLNAIVFTGDLDTSDEEIERRFVTFGANATTHSSLPPVAERYIVEYMALRAQVRDSSGDAADTNPILQAIEKEIVEAVAELEEDLTSIAILDSSMLSYSDDL